MQLKRDTEYAMRIMICIAEDRRKNGKKSGVPVSNVISSTGIPKVTFDRICGNLEEKGMIRKEITGEGEKYMYPGKGFWKQSVLSIGEAIEGNMEMFAVFDRSSCVIQKYGDKLKETQEKLNHVLSEITMESIVENHQKNRRD